MFTITMSDEEMTKIKVVDLSTQNFRPVPRTHAASWKGLLDGAVDPPSFSTGMVDPVHSSRDVLVNLTL